MKPSIDQINETLNDEQKIQIHSIDEKKSKNKFIPVNSIKIFSDEKKNVKKCEKFLNLIIILYNNE